LLCDLHRKEKGSLLGGRFFINRRLAICGFCPAIW
jgi:hypothetical protein